MLRKGDISSPTINAPQENLNAHWSVLDKLGFLMPIGNGLFIFSFSSFHDLRRVLAIM
jgi:hypothetical protein